MELKQIAATLTPEAFNNIFRNSQICEGDKMAGLATEQLQALMLPPAPVPVHSASELRAMAQALAPFARLLQEKCFPVEVTGDNNYWAIETPPLLVSFALVCLQLIEAEQHAEGVAQ